MTCTTQKAHRRSLAPRPPVAAIRDRPPLATGRAASDMASPIAAILFSAEAGLKGLSQPEPDLEAVRHLLRTIVRAGRAVAEAAHPAKVALQSAPADQKQRLSQDSAGPAWTDGGASAGGALARLLSPNLDGPSAASPTLVNALLGASAAGIVVDDDHRPPRKILRGGLARWQQRRAVSLMARLDPNPASLSDVARACQLSRGYFIKAFKQTFGVTPRRWHQHFRVERCKALLLAEELPIVEIALACGFADQSHLTRVFSQIVGSPPARWRRQSKA